jgi:hypothetical protein
MTVNRWRPTTYGPRTRPMNPAMIEAGRKRRWKRRILGPQVLAGEQEKAQPGDVDHQPGELVAADIHGGVGAYHV